MRRLHAFVVSLMVALVAIGVADPAAANERMWSPSSAPTTPIIRSYDVVAHSVGITGSEGSLSTGSGTWPGLRSVRPSRESDAGVAAEEGAASLGSTGRTVPGDLNEQLAMEQAVSNPAAGTRLPITMTDARWPAAEGWVKMSQNINGTEIHYVQNTITGAVDDFKFIGGRG